MVNRRSKVKKRKRLHGVTAVQMAVNAVTDDFDVMDLPMAEFDPAPTSLDLPEPRQRRECSRCCRPAVDRCSQCGSPLCENCIAGDGG